MDTVQLRLEPEVICDPEETPVPDIVCPIAITPLVRVPIVKVVLVIEHPVAVNVAGGYAIVVLTPATSADKLPESFAQPPIFSGWPERKRTLLV